PTYFGLLAQTTAVGGALVYGLMVIWMFGREFSDHTAKDLLALPTSRTAVVAAKLAVLAVWCMLLAVQVVVLGLAIGAALRLPGCHPARSGTCSWWPSGPPGRSAPRPGGAAPTTAGRRGRAAARRVGAGRVGVAHRRRRPAGAGRRAAGRAVRHLRRRGRGCR